jgi:uncharacterized phage infection (PIP) family protein YhgE
MAEFSQEQMNQLMSSIADLINYVSELILEQKETQRKWDEEMRPLDDARNEGYQQAIAEMQALEPMEQKIYQRARFEEFLEMKSDEDIERWVNDIEAGKDQVESAAEAGKMGTRSQAIKDKIREKRGPLGLTSK